MNDDHIPGHKRHAARLATEAAMHSVTTRDGVTAALALAKIAELVAEAMRGGHAVEISLDRNAFDESNGTRVVQTITIKVVRA